VAIEELLRKGAGLAHIFSPFSGVKNLSRLLSVLQLPFKFVHDHKSCPNSATTLLSPLMEAILAFWPRTLKITQIWQWAWEKGGGYGPRQGLPRAMCDGLDRMCKQQHLLGLIPTFKLSSYFSFASFWLAVRLFLDKKIDR